MLMLTNADPTARHARALRRWTVGHTRVPARAHAHTPARHACSNLHPHLQVYTILTPECTPIPLPTLSSGDFAAGRSMPCEFRFCAAPADSCWCVPLKYAPPPPYPHPTHTHIRNYRRARTHTHTHAHTHTRTLVVGLTHSRSDHYPTTRWSVPVLLLFRRRMEYASTGVQRPLVHCRETGSEW